MDSQSLDDAGTSATVVKPIPLGERVPPEFPDGVFRGWLGDMIEAVAVSTETPRELPMAFGLAALATVLQKRFAVRVKPDYFEPLNIWTSCSLDSGNRKTGVMDHMTSPLADWEHAKGAELDPEIAKVASERKTVEARLAKLRTESAKLSGDEFEKSKAEIASIEAAMPELPVKPQLYTEDVTPEQLGTMLDAHGERMSLLSDEAGLFDMMAGRYSKGVANLDVYLKGHAGSPVRVDRGSRPSVNLRHPALTIGISPQCEVVKGLTTNAAFRGRGLLARFLYLMPQSQLGYRSNETESVPDHIARQYAENLAMLADVEADTTATGKPVPHTLSLSPEAFEHWHEFWRQNEAMMREGNRLEFLRDWGSKLPGAVARLAGLLHCADYVSCCTSHTTIDADTIDRAIILGKVLMEHALIAFDLMGADKALQAARDIWAKINIVQKQTITKSEAWRPLRNKYKAKDVDPGFDLLVDHGYLIEVQPDEPPSRRPGRPLSTEFHVNPMLTKSWR